jgi:hypothetical protein
MKKVYYFSIAFVLISVFATAQSEKFTKAMEQRIAAMGNEMNADKWLETANGFERIADAEKTQWLPYYYAAYSHVMRGYSISNGQQGNFSDKTDPEADKAEALLAKAAALTKDNAEIFIVKKMIATLRLSADAMNRWQTQIPLGTEALANARKLDPENPRISLLEGQDKFFTPEEFGGSKAIAKKLFEDSVKKFESRKEQSSIHPSWGLQQAKYFLDLASK